MKSAFSRQLVSKWYMVNIYDVIATMTVYYANIINPNRLEANSASKNDNELGSAAM